ncbi:probable aquaporin NIP7-1 [Euphorbia lathyris]|uniref:probable aquaporin NIP7-1 n=1 Tax=Euphorbia lathyris TaxID=212925 RepID=UPI0033136958
MTTLSSRYIIMKMKHLLQDKTSSEISNNNGSSPSALSRDSCQQAGSNAGSIHGDTFVKLSKFRFLPQGLDLDPTRMVMGEMLATFILMFCVCGIIAATQLTRGQVGLMEYATTAGLTVVILIFAIGPISGGHFNPAVTIAFATFGHFPWSKVPFYVLAQTGGSVLATYAGKYIYGIKPDLLATRPLIGCGSAFWVEFIAAFIIMFLAAALTYHPSPQVIHLSGFVIGIAIGLAVLITGPVSGGSLNPARSLGPAIVSWNFKDIWVYIVAPIAGAIGGALTFHALSIHKPLPLPCGSASSPNPSLIVAHSINPFGSC